MNSVSNYNQRKCSSHEGISEVTIQFQTEGPVQLKSDSQKKTVLEILFRQHQVLFFKIQNIYKS